MQGVQDLLDQLGIKKAKIAPKPVPTWDVMEYGDYMKQSPDASSVKLHPSLASALLELAKRRESPLFGPTGKERT